MIDPTEFGKAMGAIVRAAVEPLEKRIEELEAREPAKGEKGDPGQDAEPVDIAALVDGSVAMLLESAKLETLVDLAAAKAVADYFEANPVQHGKDGADGRDGADGEPGPKGEKGDPGPAGKDGVGLSDALIDREGALVLTMTDGRSKTLGVVVGKDGRDGLSVEDFAGEYVPDRGFVLRAVRGEVEREFVLPYMVHRGFWTEGKLAKAGESMTHDGALWIAKRNTKAKPCLENGEDWILAARKGRDGKDGRNGVDRTKPVKVGDDA